MPRPQIEFLDHQDDGNVRAWIAEHRGRWEAVAETPRGVTLADSKLNEWLESWVEYRKKRGFGTKNTILRATHALAEEVFPYFLGHATPLTDPNTWPRVSFGLMEWQEARGTSEANRIHAKTALRKFWAWLADTRKILPGLDLPLDMARRTAKQTTLAYTLTPDEVLKFVKAATDPRIKLLALIGYFSSLRPQEQFALRRVDFFTGAVVEGKECCRVMAQFKYFSKMAVDIHRQRKQDGEFGPPKAFSKGLVAVFNESAATLIREILLTRGKEDLLFDHLPDWNAELWKRHGIPDLTLHDLRKASIYWLGHHGGFDLIPLKNHARHAKVETTMIYCRRPIETAEASSDDLQW